MKKLSKKVCLIGDFAVGKTSLVRRFVYTMFDDKYISTIGVKVSRKTVTLPGAEDSLVELTMMLWDLAGSEKFSNVQAGYYRGAAGAIVVCDLTRAETIVQIRTYIDNFLEINPAAKLILAANKNDLQKEHQLSLTQVESVADTFDTVYYLTSAKTGENVEELFRHLGKSLLA